MRRVVLGCTLATGFAVGVGMSPAVAGSHPSSYEKIFGNSTSCAYGRASVNDTTFKAGAKTSNFAGCNTSNAHKNVPAGYLGAKVSIRSNATGDYCGTTSTTYNTSSTWTKERTTEITNNLEASCPLPGKYFGQSAHVRKSDAGDLYYETVTTPLAWQFDLWRS